jgi:hypothetical protein
MEKIEFSDIYKFLCSIGVLLIGLAFVFPYFFLNGKFDLLVEEKKLKSLTPIAQQIIYDRQLSVRALNDHLFLISGAILIIGLIIFSIGIVNWSKKQKNIDIKEVVETQKAQYEFGQMTNQDVSTKVVRELEEDNIALSSTSSTTTTTTTQYPPTAQQSVNYVLIEQKIISKIHEAYKDYFSILANQKIDEIEFDAILKPNNIIGTNYILEIKYAQASITTRFLQNTISRVARAMRKYQSATDRLPNAIVIIVFPKIIKKEWVHEMVLSVQEHIPVEMLNRWKYVFIHEEDIAAADMTKYLELS